MTRSDESPYKSPGVNSRDGKAPDYEPVAIVVLSSLLYSVGVAFVFFGLLTLFEAEFILQRVGLLEGALPRFVVGSGMFTLGGCGWFITGYFAWRKNGWGVPVFIIATAILFAGMEVVAGAIPDARSLFS